MKHSACFSLNAYCNLFRIKFQMTRCQQQMRQLLRRIRTHVLRIGCQLSIIGFGEGLDEGKCGFTRIALPRLIVRPRLVMRQEIQSMRLIERGITGKFQFSLTCSDFRIDLGISFQVMRFFLVAPMWLFTMVFTQLRECPL